MRVEIRAGAQLGITRATHSRVPNTARQEPYSEIIVWGTFEISRKSNMFNQMLGFLGHASIPMDASRRVNMTPESLSPTSSF